MKRNLCGIFPVYKHVNITSGNILTKIKECLLNEFSNVGYQLKLGHGGTLDFTACGVLVVGAGSACSYLKFFQKGEKAYITTGLLGVATDTYNDEGKITMEKSFDHISLESIQHILGNYRGRILQVPPLYSALKLHGERYADLTRKGVKVKLLPRPVQCFNLELIDFSPPSFTLKLSCGGGFYVRSLVHDIGLALGSCAHVTKLERVNQGPFTMEDSLKEEDWSYKNISNSINKNKKVIDKYFSKLVEW